MMSATIIEKTIDTWTSEPSKAKGKPSVKARMDRDIARLESGTFSWSADLPAALGGCNQAPSPTALLLSALAGCAVLFVRDTLAPQLGVRIDGIEATARCETDSRGLLGLDGAIPDLQSVSLDVHIESPDPEEAIRHLMEVWKQRCPIFLALTRPTPAEITTSVVNWYSPA
jgi:uncharacterized OsmC-like protein